MLKGEEVLRITFMEQKFGSSYTDLATLWRNYEQVYLPYRLSKIQGSKLGRASISSIECTLDMLNRVRESIRLIPGDELQKEIMYAKIDGDRDYFWRLKNRATYNIGKEFESMA